MHQIKEIKLKKQLFFMEGYTKKIGAVNYFECSSFSGLNFDIFEKTVQYIEQRDYEYRKKCILF